MFALKLKHPTAFIAKDIDNKNSNTAVIISYDHSTGLATCIASCDLDKDIVLTNSNTQTNPALTYLYATARHDLTTFQTPFGALCLVTLPMGWTNSVPIFHNNITFILQPEIPHNVLSFINDVGAKGPKDWKIINSNPAKHPANPNICLALWEFFKLLNSILQQMKYCSSTFSGHKLVLYALTFKILGHVCTPSSQIPDESCLALLKCWGPCKLLSEVRAFLGTVGVLRIFVKNFAYHANNLTKLTRVGIPFKFGPDQINAQQGLVKALKSIACMDSFTKSSCHSFTKSPQLPVDYPLCNAPQLVNSNNIQPLHDDGTTTYSNILCSAKAIASNTCILLVEKWLHNLVRPEGLSNNKYTNKLQLLLSTIFGILDLAAADYFKFGTSHNIQHAGPSPSKIVTDNGLPILVPVDSSLEFLMDDLTAGMTVSALAVASASDTAKHLVGALAVARGEGWSEGCGGEEAANCGDIQEAGLSTPKAAAGSVARGLATSP
ncbi:hypothetical protein J132_04686 [Termitomyces sp. J132]|nr:hypothetical protein J132_04686 [Termitomyces sp. J132]